MRRYLAFLALCLSAIAPLHAQTLSDVLCSLQERVDVLQQRARLDAHLGSSQAETELPAIVWNGLDNPPVPNPTDGQVANLGVAGQVALLNQAITEFSALRRYFLNLRPEDLAIDSRIGALRPFLREDFPDLGRADADNFHATVAALARQVAALRVLPWVAQVTTEKLDYTTTKEEIYENGNFSEVLSPVDPGGWQPVSLEAGVPVGLAEGWRKISAIRAGSPFTNFESLTASGTYTVTTYHDGPNDQNGHSTDYDLKKVYVRRVTEYINGVRLYMAAPEETATAIRGRIALTTRVEWNDDTDDSIGSGAPSWQPTDAAYHVIAASSPPPGGGQAPLMEPKSVDAPDFDVKLKWSGLTELQPDLSRSTGTLKTRRGADAWVQVTNLSRASFAVFAPTFTLGVDATAQRDALARAAEIPAPPPAVPSVILHPSPGVLVGIPLGAGLEGTSTGWLGVCPGSYEFNSSGDPDPMQPDVFDLGVISPAYNSVGAYTTASLAIRADHAANLRFIGVAADFHVVYATGRGADQRGADLPENQPTAADLAASGWEIQEVLTANDLPRIRQIVGRDYIADVAMNDHFKATVTLYRRPAGSDAPSRTPGEVEDVSELTSLGSFVFERPDTSGLFPHGFEITRVTDGDSNVYQVSHSSLNPATAAIAFTGPFYQKTLTPGTNSSNQSTVTIAEALDEASLGTTTLTAPDADWRWWGNRSPLVASSVVGSHTTTATATFDPLNNITPGSQGRRFPSALAISDSIEGASSLVWDANGILTSAIGAQAKRITSASDDVVTHTSYWKNDSGGFARVATDWIEFTGPASLKRYSAPDGSATLMGDGSVSCDDIQFGEGDTGIPGLPHRITRNDGTATLYEWAGTVGGAFTATVKTGKLTDDTLERGTKTTTTINAGGYPEHSATTLTISGTDSLQTAGWSATSENTWGAPLTATDLASQLEESYAWDGDLPRLTTVTDLLGFKSGITTRDALGRPTGFNLNAATGTITRGVRSIDTSINLGGVTTTHQAWDALGRITACDLTHAGTEYTTAISHVGTTATIASGNDLTGASTSTVLDTMTGGATATGSVLPFGGLTGSAITVDSGLIHTKSEVTGRSGTFRETWTDAWGRVRKSSVPSPTGTSADVTECFYSAPESTIRRVIIQEPSTRHIIHEYDPYNPLGITSRIGIDSVSDSQLDDSDRQLESITTIDDGKLKTVLTGPGEPDRRTLLVTLTDPATGITTREINQGEEFLTTTLNFPDKTVKTVSNKGWKQTGTINNLGLPTQTTVGANDGGPDAFLTTTVNAAWRADGTLSGTTLQTGTAITSADFDPNGLLTGLSVPIQGDIFGGHSFDPDDGSETLTLAGVETTRAINGTAVSLTKAANTPDSAAPTLTPVTRTLALDDSGPGFKTTIAPGTGSPSHIITNAAGAKTKHDYASEDDIGSTWLPDGYLASVACARGGDITFGYSADGARDLASIVYPAAGTGTAITEEFTHYPSGRTKTIDDRSGSRLLTYTRGHLWESTWVNTGEPLSGYEVERVTDDNGRLQSVNLRRGGALVHTHTIGYNGGSTEPSSITTGGFTASYGRIDPNTRAITSVTRGALAQIWIRGTAGRIQGASAAGLSYTHSAWDARARRKNLITPNGSWSYDYDSNGQLERATKGTIELNYTFDAIGRRLGFGDNGNDSLNQFVALHHSQIKRLFIAAAAAVPPLPAASLDVWVDGVQVPTSQMTSFNQGWLCNLPSRTGGGWIPWTIRGTVEEGGDHAPNADAKAELSGYTWVPPQDESFTYDADGNRTGSALWTYRWDGRNKLVGAATRDFDPTPENNHTAAPEGRKVTFDYDAEGRRFQKTVIHKTTKGLKVVETAEKITYLWDGWNLIYERHENEFGMRLWDREYLWGEDLAGGMDGGEGAGGAGGLLLIRDHRGESTTDYYPCYDTSGHVIALTDSAGAVAATYEYGPFGELLSAKGPMSAANPFRYATKYYDVETGLYYFGQRYYDPATAQWMNREPLGEDESLNLYSYCNNDPVNKVDRLGLQAVAVCSQQEVDELRAVWLLSQLTDGVDNPIAPTSDQTNGLSETGRFGMRMPFAAADLQRAFELRKNVLAGLSGPSIRAAADGEIDSRPTMSPTAQLPDVSVHALTTALGGPYSQEMAQFNAGLLLPVGAEGYLLKGALNGLRLGRLMLGGASLERAMLIKGVSSEIRTLPIVTRTEAIFLDTAALAARNTSIGSGGLWATIGEAVDKRTIRQLSPVSCGPACAQMLLRGQGVDAYQSGLALLQGSVVTRHAEELGAAMSQYGYVWRGGFYDVFANPKGAFSVFSRNGSFATTMHSPGMQMSHMVVVDGFDAAGRVIIRDPAGAGTRYLMTWSDFVGVWQGQTIYRP